MDFKKEELIKSPLNYTGGKFKLLPQILPLFPNNINTFYDIFGGGGSVSLNIRANYIYYNDINKYISSMFNNIKGQNCNECLKKIHNLIKKYNLSKENLNGFLKLREEYNNGNRTWDMLYTLICYSFNYQFRFNNKHEYNSSFGKNKSCFSNSTEDKFSKFINKINNIDIVFDSKDFRDVNYCNLDGNDFVYFDPPYLITCGNYNDGKRGFKGWKQQDDIDLINLCDDLNNKGVKFALSNVLENKGKSNDILKEWSKKYNVYHLNNTYGNCNYHAKDKSKNNTDEVLITNY